MSSLFIAQSLFHLFHSTPYWCIHAPNQYQCLVLLCVHAVLVNVSMCACMMVGWQAKKEIMVHMHVYQLRSVAVLPFKMLRKKVWMCSNMRARDSACCFTSTIHIDTGGVTVFVCCHRWERAGERERDGCWSKNRYVYRINCNIASLIFRGYTLLCSFHSKTFLLIDDAGIAHFDSHLAWNYHFALLLCYTYIHIFGDSCTFVR